MHKKLHLDVETYSSVDIKNSGAYKYTQSVDFEILLLAYAFDDEDIKIVDLCQGESIPEEVFSALLDKNIEKHAHNANFERNCFKAIGLDIPIDQWYCSAIKAAYCGLPLSLKGVSSALNLSEDAKLSTGTALIRYFCCPVRPTKVNGGRVRNFPHHNLEKWEAFKEYCIGDVRAERAIGRHLKSYTIPEWERQNYILDQEINDRGIKIDVNMAKNAIRINEEHSKVLQNRLKEITNLDNPNSPVQLKKWLSQELNRPVTGLTKADITELLEKVAPGPVKEVLELRRRTAKTSIKKYIAMLNCVCYDGKAHGLFQFYGANRTGRWAGRLIQLQNLPQNHLKDLDGARTLFASGNYQDAVMVYDRISDTLSQLIRTAFVAPEGRTFAVADFSSIEARVIAWLADEKWRLDVFNGHAKIYEASASMMFGVPIEQITKGSELRQRGKVAELALGYQGGVGALKQMGGERMGLSEVEMDEIKIKWRAKSPNIVKLWKKVEKAAVHVVKTNKAVRLPSFKNLVFACDGKYLTITLPSGRKLFYQSPKIATNDWGSEIVKYKGSEQQTGKWVYLSTYGGKLTENIVQAIARDLLAYSMLALDKEGFKIVMHVHDEAVVDISDLDIDEAAQAADWTNNDILDQMCEIMSKPVPWAEGLPLAADGYITPYYKKD